MGAGILPVALHQGQLYFLFGEEFDEDLGADDEKIELDEDELISFLNEYYTINEDSIPKSELY